tara:strand:- start:87 stop:251 length:165 start_codon:yes stop_codon:yes gene_type:complete
MPYFFSLLVQKMENPWALLNPKTLHDPNFNETEQKRMEEEENKKCEKFFINVNK